MHYAQVMTAVMENIYQIKEDKRFELFCSELSPENANAARKDRAAKKERGQEIRAKHRRDLEIAKAGKTEVIINNFSSLGIF